MVSAELCKMMMEIGDFEKAEVIARELLEVMDDNIDHLLLFAQAAEKSDPQAAKQAAKKAYKEFVRLQMPDEMGEPIRQLLERIPGEVSSSSSDDDEQ